MMRFYFIATAAFLFLCQSCKSNKKREPYETLKDAANRDDINTGNLNFKFDLPQNWIRLDTVLQGMKFSFLMPGHAIDNFRPIINISNELIHGQMHEDYIAGTKRYLVNNMEGIESLNDGAFDIAGKKCMWYTYNKSQNGIKREMVYYSIAVNDISYNITAGVNDGGIQTYKPIFDKIIKSFRLVNQ